MQWGYHCTCGITRCLEVNLWSSSDASFHSVSALITLPRNNSGNPRWKLSFKGYMTLIAVEFMHSQEMLVWQQRDSHFGLWRKWHLHF